MKTLFRYVIQATVVAGLLGHNAALAQTTYNQATVSAFANGANAIEKSATANTAANFRTAVGTAWTNGSGGVFNLPTTVAAGTTVYRGTYGDGKRMHITSSVNMQNITTGTFTVMSSPNGTTSQANQSDYTLTFGLFDTNSDLPLVDETIKEIGIPILSRNAAGFPLDLLVTVTFSDGSTQAVTAAIASGAGVDDTFFGFTAPGDLGIASLRLQSFVPGTSTPVADRLAWDDFGFVTAPAVVVPEPLIVNVTPAAYAFHNASNGIHFETLTFVAIDPTNISLVLNSNDVSSQLIVSGDPTNYSVSYFGLVEDQEYQMTIGVTNSGGVTVLERIFYTKTNEFVLYDSGSFTDDTLYPLGALQNVTHGRGTWLPNALEPAQVVNVGAPQDKVLERQATGVSRPDYLGFPPFSSGIITIEFDAFISTMLGRTIDVCLQTPSAGTAMATLLAWGEVPGKLAYFDNANWIPIADLTNDWHHVKLIHYLSGLAGGTSDILLNGTPVAQKIAWRNLPAGAVFNQFRLHTQNTAALFEFGRIDNLVVTAAPEDPNVFPPPQIYNLNISTNPIIPPADSLQFAVASGIPISATNITVLLDSNNISSSLVVTGPATNLSVSYAPLGIGNHIVEIQAVSEAGPKVMLPQRFIVTDEPWLLHPADGWVSPWQWTSGFPELLTTSPMDASSPYLQLNTTASAARNLMREYQSGAVDISKPHYIRWKFRLSEPDFDSNFAVFNDRVHFFAHPVSRLTASTTGGNSWAIIAAGAASAGVATNKAFYIFDNVEGNGTFNGANHVNSQVLLRPDHIYSFELLVRPADKSYLVEIVDETDSVSFTSSAPHQFRDLTDATHTFLHFGVQASSAALSRTFDLDSVSVTQATLPVTLLNPTHNGATFSFSFQSQAGTTHIAQYLADITSSSWTSLVTNVGDGTMITVTHTNPPAGPLFYRVNSQLP